MASPLNAIQAAVYTRLTGYSALTTELGGSKVYDNVPFDSTPPYVVIGEDTAIDGSVKDVNGWETTLTVHSWDFERAGRKSIKTIMAHIYDALNRSEANISVSGFTLVSLHCEYQQTLQETGVEGSNDKYYHGVQRFRALITETSL